MHLWSCQGASPYNPGASWEHLVGQQGFQLLPPWFPQRGNVWKHWEKVWGSVSCTSTSDHTSQKAASLSQGGWTCFSPLQATQSCSGLPARTGVLSLWPGSASFLEESTRSFFLQKERCWVKKKKRKKHSAQSGREHAAWWKESWT